MYRYVSNFSRYPEFLYRLKTVLTWKNEKWKNTYHFLTGGVTISLSHFQIGLIVENVTLFTNTSSIREFKRSVLAETCALWRARRGDCTAAAWPASFLSLLIVERVFWAVETVRGFRRFLQFAIHSGLTCDLHEKLSIFYYHIWSSHLGWRFIGSWPSAR